MAEYHDSFLDGNEVIEEAIAQYAADSSQDRLIRVLDTIRQRMHADGHFIFPVLVDEKDENSFIFRTIQSRDGKMWCAAFTSQSEFEKGAQIQVISHFIDSAMNNCLDSGLDGLIINPWGQAFLLPREQIEAIFAADGDVAYHVPDDPITEELLADGSFLENAIGICSRNRTQLNLIKLARILRDSWVWIPCTAILSDADYGTVEAAVKKAEANGGLDSLIGQSFVNEDEVRFVPDVLQNGEEFFFPVFSSEQVMGEYGDHFSKVQNSFLEAINLALHNERDIAGIVINAFSEPFVIPRDMFEFIAGLESCVTGDVASNT